MDVQYLYLFDNPCWIKVKSNQIKLFLPAIYLEVQIEKIVEINQIWDNLDQALS